MASSADHTDSRAEGARVMSCACREGKGVIKPCWEQWGNW